jgi:hypothetical protein
VNISVPIREIVHDVRHLTTEGITEKELWDCVSAVSQVEAYSCTHLIQAPNVPDVDDVGVDGVCAGDHSLIVETDARCYCSPIFYTKGMNKQTSANS